MCPIKDHRGNGIVERRIRRVNERLSPNRKILLLRNSREISNKLFAFRTQKAADGKSAFVKQTGSQPATLKSVMIRKCIVKKIQTSTSSQRILVRKQILQSSWENAPGRWNLKEPSKRGKGASLAIEIRPSRSCLKLENWWHTQNEMWLRQTEIQPA